MRGMDGDVATAGGAPATSMALAGACRTGTANAPLAHVLRTSSRFRDHRKNIFSVPVVQQHSEIKEHLRLAMRMQDERRREHKLLGENIRRRVERGLEAYDEELENRRDRLRELLVRDEARLARELAEADRKLEERRATELQERASEVAASREAVRRELLRVKELQRFAQESQELRLAGQRARAENSKRANLEQIAQTHERRRQEREDEEYWNSVLRQQCETKDALNSQMAERRAEQERRIAEQLRDQIQMNSFAKKQQQQSTDLNGEDSMWRFEDANDVKIRRQAERKKIREELDKQLREARECLERRRIEELELERVMSSSLDDKTSRGRPEDERRDKETRRREILANMRSMKEFREVAARHEAEADDCARRWACETEVARREAQRRAKEDSQRRSQELRLAWDRQLEEKQTANQRDNCDQENAATYAEEEKAERVQRHLAAQNYGRELLAQKDYQQVSRMQERRCLDEFYEKQRTEREQRERRMAQELTTLGSRLRISGIP